MIIITIVITSIAFGSIDSKSLSALPLQLNKGNWIIEATLIDESSDVRYSIKEYIFSGQNIRGKISIESDSISSLDVHYSTGSINQRLVIYGKY
uniref:Uncharacterized protein n=1 Tax=Tetranychus urticae TaxID=32264 RepID=T1K274_TETUR